MNGLSLNFQGETRILGPDGKVSVLVNGQPDSRHHWYGMDRLFDYIEADLERDKKGQRRNFTRAIFDPVDGALRWYVRFDRANRQRANPHTWPHQWSATPGSPEMVAA